MQFPAHPAARKPQALLDPTLFKQWEAEKSKSNKAPIISSREQSGPEFLEQQSRNLTPMLEAKTGVELRKLKPSSQDWKTLQDCACSYADRLALLKSFKDLGWPLRKERIPKPELRNSQTRLGKGMESGSFNAVYHLRSRQDRDKAWVFKPAPLKSQLRSSELMRSEVYGYGPYPDFNGHNLAAREIDKMLGWDVMVECEPAQLQGSMGIAMSPAGESAPTHRKYVKVQGPRALRLAQEYILAVQAEGVTGAHRFLKKYRLLAFDILPDGKLSIGLNARRKGDRLHDLGSLSTCRARFEFEIQGLKLLRKGILDGIVENTDGHNGNYRLHPERGLQAFDLDFSCGDKYTHPREHPVRLRLNLDTQVEWPTAVDHDTCRDIENLDLDECARRIEPFLRPEAKLATIERLKNMKLHLKTVERFDQEEFFDVDEQKRVKKYAEEPWSSYVGRDFFATFMHEEITEILDESRHLDFLAEDS